MKCINEIFKEISSRLLYKMVVLDIKTRGQRVSSLFIDVEITYSQDNYDYFGLNICEDSYGCCLYDYKLDYPLGILNPIEKINVNETVNYNTLIPSQIPNKQYKNNFVKNYVVNFHIDVFCDVCYKYLYPPYLYNDEIDIDLCTNCFGKNINYSPTMFKYLLSPNLYKDGMGVPKDWLDKCNDYTNIIFKTKRVPTDYLKLF